ncbi:MAG: hypothetical protein DRH04_03550 [Deltaproteobacteria bacterium]|nr:MAG: hypothetical protein DRH04_03550 [Deltaproteobacteria bacterium]
MKNKLKAMGYSIESVLEHDDFNGRDGQAHWKVTISRNGQSFCTSYSMGCAHRHYKGTNEPIKLGFRRLTLWQEEQNKQTVPNKPTLVDVLYSLVLDARLVRFGQDFAEFATELGYDEDSRRASRAFEGCLDEWRGLCRLGADFDELEQLLQDY